MIDEGAKHPIDLRLGRRVAFGLQCAFDHAQYTASDHPTPVVVSYRRQAFARQDKIERRDEIGSGIDQRAVEIENNGEHDSFLITVRKMRPSMDAQADLSFPM